MTRPACSPDPVSEARRISATVRAGEHASSTPSAVLLLGRAEERRSLGELLDAEILHAAAYDVATLGGDARGRVDALTGLARVVYARGHVELAAECFEAAAHVAREGGDVEAALLSAARFAFVVYDDGDIARAERILSGMREEARPYRRLSGIVAGYLGNTARARRDLDLARALYHESQDALQAAGDELMHATFLIDEAALELLREASLAASACIEAATGPAGGPQDWQFRLLLGNYRALLRLIHGTSAQRDEERSALAAGSAPATATQLVRFLESSRALALHALDAQTEPARRKARDEYRRLRERCPRNEHARVTLALVRPLLGARDDAGAALVVAKEGASFRFGPGLDADLSTRTGPRALLCHLARARIETPGRAVPLTTLIEAAWPGERLSAASARNRAHVALATLRKLGLDSVILRKEEGYLLDPETPVSLVS